MYERKSRLSAGPAHGALRSRYDSSSSSRAGWGSSQYRSVLVHSVEEVICQELEEASPLSIVYTDSFRSYDALDVSSFHHVRIDQRMKRIRALLAGRV